MERFAHLLVRSTPSEGLCCFLECTPKSELREVGYMYGEMDPLHVTIAAIPRVAARKLTCLLLRSLCLHAHMSPRLRLRLLASRWMARWRGYVDLRT